MSAAAGPDGPVLGATSMPAASEHSVISAVTLLWLAATAEGLGMGSHSVTNVQTEIASLYTRCMEVSISTLRAELASWIERAREGEEIIVTDRGTPVVRLSSVDTAPLLEQLTQSGVLGTPRRADRPSASRTARVNARGPVAELVSEQRR